MERLGRIYYCEFVPELEPEAVVPKSPEPYKPGELCTNEFCMQPKPHTHVEESDDEQS